MKYIIILTIASMASAAKLEKVYLPPNVASAGGADAGLLTPFEANQGQNHAVLGGNQAVLGGNHGLLSNQAEYASQRYANQAQILKYENEINENGYHYAYETSDGSKAEQDGQIIPGPVAEEGSLRVSGSYSYVGDDGQTYTVLYVADENGFQASGNHLPTPPPIPEAILRSLQLTDKEGIYSSKKSSYDADAGY